MRKQKSRGKGKDDRADGIGRRLDPMWMQLIASKAHNGTPQKKLLKADVAKHASETDMWMILGDMVYDVTTFRTFHPGGVPSLMKAAGDDGTQWFSSVHPWVNIEAILGPYCVGTLVQELPAKSPSSPSQGSPTASEEASANLAAVWEVLVEKSGGQVTVQHVRDMLFELEMDTESIDKIPKLKESPVTPVSSEMFERIFHSL
eukprot:TRINITY_DN62549_c0_g1_i1.p1 TRINITY_DN62549_c0_g1~~TRINITY_DN62549_c0_g1_i1.p1  ORF type:complete len:203 (-),score=13.10 TRINITY_DN62549_c0_g1_i1:543-1151(-)